VCGWQGVQMAGCADGRVCRWLSLSLFLSLPDMLGGYD